MSDKIEKLPKWAQEHIRDLERQRDVAVKTLDQFQSNQEKGPFLFWTFSCHTSPPVQVRRYFDAHNMQINYAGIQVNIVLRNDSIEMQYSEEHHFTGEVALQPYAYQGFRLKLPRVEKEREVA